MLNLSGRSKGHGQGTVDRHNTIIHTAAALAHENIQGDAISGGGGTKLPGTVFQVLFATNFRCVFINKNSAVIKYDCKI
jgi:hypothetical protein